MSSGQERAGEPDQVAVDDITGFETMKRAARSRQSLRFTELPNAPEPKSWTDLRARDPDQENITEPSTPNLSESFLSLRRTLSLSHLSTLPRTLDHSLTPHPLSTHPSQIFDPDILRSALGTVARETKDVVWRPPGERARRPGDAERALVLSIQRAIRSGTLAYLIRAGINLLLLLLRGARRPSRSWTRRAFLHALFGAEPFRFAGMIGVFTGLNTFVLHLLRLGRIPEIWRQKLGIGPPARRRAINNASNDKPILGLGLLTTDSPRPSSSDPESALLTASSPISSVQPSPETGREPEREDDHDSGERIYHAAIAGAVGSLGLLCESRSRRGGVAQQLFVRGLQASYNISSLTYPSLTLPYSLGPILTFGLCCGQIMFAFLLSPETIPKEYNDWILAASGVKRSALVVNLGLERAGKVAREGVEAALAVRNITPHNRRELLKLLEKGKSGLIPDGVPCAAIHPWLDSCRAVQIERYFTTVRFMLPVYSALHFIPMLVLRSSHVRRDPLGMLGKAAWGTLRSSSFLAVFVLIYQGLLCFRTQLLEGYLGQLPTILRRLLKRKQSFWFIGFMTCFSLFVEEKRRRAELAMYVLPKALESAWSSARKRAWVPLVPFGENLLGAAAMAMVMHAYKHDPQSLSGLVRRVMYQMIGPA